MCSLKKLEGLLWLAVLLGATYYCLILITN